MNEQIQNHGCILRFTISKKKERKQKRNQANKTKQNKTNKEQKSFNYRGQCSGAMYY